MLRKKQKNQSGFTLIELLVAISIFAIFITVASSSLVGVLKLEQKANILRQTQTDARYILETISREARSANGELNAKKERVFPAYSFDSPTSPTRLTITSTDFQTNKVTQKVYYQSGDVIRFDKLSKDIGGAGYTDEATAVGLNNPTDMKVVSFSFVGSVTNPDLLIPPKLVMELKAESGRGRNFVRDEYRAYVELKTSVSPRNY